MIDFKKKMQELEELEGQQNLEERQRDTSLQQKRKKIKNYLIAIIIIVLVFSGKIIMSSQSATDWLPGINFFNRLLSFVPVNEKLLSGEEEDRINVLLLGMGGETHEAGNLTDTIMVVSFKPSTKQVSMISLPRDLTAPTNNWRKINSINAYAEKENPGSGGEETAKAIGDLLQIPIPYYIRVDFTGFEKIIDELGGVEINVENSFTDYTYPIKGQENNPDYYARFEKLSFTAGPTKMDGSLALKYARSRHALGIEGSDFARARRQQLLLEAIKSKFFSHETLLNPVILGKLINEFSKNLNTNFSPWELIRLWDIFKDVDRDQIINKVLNDAPDNYLVAGQGQDGAYILMPRTGNFSEIQNMIRNIFDSKNPSSLKIEINDAIEEEANVFVANGTWINGLAGKSAEKLTSYGFNVVGTGNYQERDYQNSTVYDLSRGKKQKTLKAIKEIAEADQAFDEPDWLEEYRNGENNIDILLIIGTEANK